MGCLDKIISFHKRYKKRCRNFWSSSIAGLFTGAMIGILFSLITDAKFNRWINLMSYELFAAVIYVGLTIFMLWFFYHLGKLLLWVILHFFRLSSKKDELVGFKINFVAGIYSALFATSLILLSKERVSLYVGIMFGLLYFPVEYFAVRTKSKKKK